MDASAVCVRQVNGDFLPVSPVNVTTTPLSVTPKQAFVRIASMIQLETNAKNVRRDFTVMPLEVCFFVKNFIYIFF